MTINWILFGIFLASMLSIPFNEDIYIFTLQVTVGLTATIILDKRLNRDRKWRKHSNS